MSLATLWFCLVAVLWSGYFLLEGFDFGVGILLPFLGPEERDRGRMLETIAPVWDGNEVWLVVAAGATFAAFPAWYATMFSGFYLALLLVLVLLIVRVVSFEWRERGRGARWRAAWAWANTIGSVGAPLVWGIALAALLYGVPLDAQGHPTGDVLDLLNAYTVLGGISVVLLFALHGAAFTTLRTSGGLRARAAAAARRLAIPVAVVVIGFWGWTAGLAIDANGRDPLGALVPAVAGALLLTAAAVLLWAGRAGWGFAMTSLAAPAWVATVFCALYPYVLVSRPEIAHSLTVSGAATAHYALTVITVVAAILTPVVLLYQAWTYHVFRVRVAGADHANRTMRAGTPRP